MNRGSAGYVLLLAALALVTSNAESCEASKLPKLSAEEVLLRAKRFVSERDLITEDQKVTEVVYLKERCSWLVMYKSDSLDIGDGGFGLMVSENSERITLQKGL